MMDQQYLLYGWEFLLIIIIVVLVYYFVDINILNKPFTIYGVKINFDGVLYPHTILTKNDVKTQLENVKEIIDTFTRNPYYYQQKK